MSEQKNYLEEEDKLSADEGCPKRTEADTDRVKLLSYLESRFCIEGDYTEKDKHPVLCAVERMEAATKKKTLSLYAVSLLNGQSRRIAKEIDPVFGSTIVKILNADAEVYCFNLREE